MTGIKKREGILGTDIFCKLGLETTAAARPGETALTTVIGLIMAPDVLCGLDYRIRLLPSKAVDADCIPALNS